MALRWRPCHAASGKHFGAHVLDEILHLPIHLFHALPHLQNNGDAGNIDAQFARQVENELQPLQVFIRVQTRVSHRARGLQQPFALIKPQCLRVDLVHLGNCRDHVCAFGFTLRRHFGSRASASVSHTPAKVASLGSSGFSFANSRKISFDRSSRRCGTTISTVTIWSPRTPRASPKERPCRACAASARSGFPGESSAAPGRRWWAPRSWLQSRFRHRHWDHDLNIVARPCEYRMAIDLDNQIKVARRPAVNPRVAFACKPYPLSVAGAGLDADLDRLGLGDGTFAIAGRTALSSLPVPPQRGQAILNFMRPPIWVTCPVPWHSGQVPPPPEGFPLQVGQISCRTTCSLATPPRIAVQKSTVIWYSRSVPACGPCCFCPWENTPEKMSRKLPQLEPVLPAPRHVRRDGWSRSRRSQSRQSRERHALRLAAVVSLLRESRSPREPPLPQQRDQSDRSSSPTRRRPCASSRRSIRRWLPRFP